MSNFSRNLLCRLALTIALLVVLPAPLAHAMKRVQLPTDAQGSGLFSVAPDRYEGDVHPGKTTTVTMRLTNETGSPVQVTLNATDLAAAADLTSLIEMVDDGKYGAGSWLEFEQKTFRMEQREQVEFGVKVMPPLDAPVGTNLAGVQVEAVAISDDASTPGTAVNFRIEGLAQIFVIVPGEIRHDTRIVSAKVSDSFLFHGSGFVAYEVEFENRGNVNDHVSGEIAVRSMFGNAVESLPINETIVVRGSRRIARVIWPSPPRFGRFVGHAQVTSDSKNLRAKTSAVVILPPWWWFVAFFVVIVLPLIYTMWQRRRAWRAYLADEFDDENFDDAAWDSNSPG